MSQRGLGGFHATCYNGGNPHNAVTPHERLTNPEGATALASALATKERHPKGLRQGSGVKPLRTRHFSPAPAAMGYFLLRSPLYTDSATPIIA
ncbi:MAG: hypothetical protein KME32_07675 [Mojavia pulchra JT2-VF2]|uniref:Uncharacterized protein n=1 Tax=Mojavia pulchra JT2-VF2 TaxID=287848 RepID=A0A951PXJ8_9NOST|nr:hypothetical protein [Mojavia pulchra JT2-VF2]